MRHLPDPLAELESIWHRGAEENDADVIWQHNQNLLPHDPSLRKNKRMVTEETVTDSVREVSLIRGTGSDL